MRTPRTAILAIPGAAESGAGPHASALPQALACWLREQTIPRLHPFLHSEHGP